MLAYLLRINQWVECIDYIYWGVVGICLWNLDLALKVVHLFASFVLKVFFLTILHKRPTWLLFCITLTDGTANKAKLFPVTEQSRGCLYCPGTLYYVGNSLNFVIAPFKIHGTFKIGRLDVTVYHFRCFLLSLFYYELLVVAKNLPSLCFEFERLRYLWISFCFVFNQGKMDSAASMIEKAILANPSYAEAYNNLGTLVGFLSKLSRSLSSLTFMV